MSARNDFQVPYHALDATEVLRELRTDDNYGLTTGDIKERQTKYGLNKFSSSAPQRGFIWKLWTHVNSIFIYILIAAIVLEFLFGHWINGVVICGILALNIMISLSMEGKAESSTRNLQDLMSHTAIVLRNGSKQSISAKELTIGDIFFLSVGDVVPADGRLLECYDFQVSEASLTGDTLPVGKSTNPIKPMDYRYGSLVAEDERNQMTLEDDPNKHSTSPPGLHSSSVMSPATTMAEKGQESKTASPPSSWQQQQIGQKKRSNQNLDTSSSVFPSSSHSDVTSAPKGFHAPLKQRQCMVYSSSEVLKGTATCVVTAIGDNCEFGKIHTLLNNNDNSSMKTPLISELEKLSITLGLGVLLLAVITVIAASEERDYSRKDAFSLGIGVGVAAIPISLSSCLLITFSIGIYFMSKRNALVKSLPTVETLGSVNVICTDKTGTLTVNRTSIQVVSTHSDWYRVSVLFYYCLSFIHCSVFLIRC
jgi:magnesium-transporting ATPase (P-type)